MDTLDLQLAMKLQQVCRICMHVLQVDRLYAGEVGWLSASIKAVADARVGDTITLKKAPAAKALPGQLGQAEHYSIRGSITVVSCSDVKNVLPQSPLQCISCCPCAAS